MISLWNHTHTGTAGAARLAPAGARSHRLAGRRDTTAGSMVVIVGDTHRIQLSWAALWDGQIGRARLIDPPVNDRARCRPTAVHRSPSSAA